MVNRVDVSLLQGIDLQRETLTANTRRFADGLPGRAVHDIVVASDGRIWTANAPVVDGAVLGREQFEKLTRELLDRHRPDVLALTAPFPGNVYGAFRMARIAQECLETGAPLPPLYKRYFWWWFALGWPAFIAMLVIFWLMVAKPQF